MGKEGCWVLEGRKLMMVHGGVGFEGEVSLKGAVLGGVLGGYYFGRPQGCTFGQRGDPGGVTLEEGVLGALV